MKHRFTPIMMAIAMVLGILIGLFYGYRGRGVQVDFIGGGVNKVNYLLHLIDNNYVDSVDINQLIEDALPKIIGELDPHSRYISASEMEAESEPLRGSFGGIGVSFTIQKDTVNVMSVIPSGPAEKVGIMPGDRIIMADTVSLIGMKDVEVMKRLKGEIQTSVKLTIVRYGYKEPLMFNVKRDEIPVVSVDASYLMPDDIGYMRIKNFGEHTYSEMMVALASMNVEGMHGLIMDLRGNSGGYMHIAIQMVNEFLPKDQLIVYTEGRNTKRMDYPSDGYGSFQNLPLVVLMDEGSASASEIFAGAIQDNDRGTIIGRRSFGKGLVQEPITFKDGSSIRLTIARYYTPSGRCIQKPYVNGHGEDYENDLLARYQRGEFFSQDSIRQEGEAYQTRMGRTVYGGGGITPDIFVPEDTTAVTSYYKEALLSGLLRQFAFSYADSHRAQLSKVNTTEKLEAFLLKENLTEKFAKFGESHGLKRRNLLMQKSASLFQRNLVGSIIYDLRSMQEYIEYLNQDDPTVKKAHEILKEKKSYPQ
ncbi:MAG: S41 family peptidase, partial [Bacteroidaceae bacterium]|nr:S41 family peptidase [Bacteroidaceae bacterium]